MEIILKILCIIEVILAFISIDLGIYTKSLNPLELLDKQNLLIINGIIFILTEILAIIIIILLAI